VTLLIQCTNSYKIIISLFKTSVYLEYISEYILSLLNFSICIKSSYFFVGSFEKKIFKWPKNFSLEPLKSKMRYLCVKFGHGKNGFAKIFKNLAKYRSENNFVGLSK